MKESILVAFQCLSLSIEVGKLTMVLNIANELNHLSFRPLTKALRRGIN